MTETLRVMSQRVLRPELSITYESGIDEPVHPDFSIAIRMEEVAISDCRFGCKIYADPRSQLRVLGHFRVYGCTVTKKELSDGQQEPPGVGQRAADPDRHQSFDCAGCGAGRHDFPAPALVSA